MSDVERCEGCGRRMVDDPKIPGGLICPMCDDDSHLDDEQGEAFPW